MAIGDGLKIGIRFDETLISGSGNEDAFTVSFQEYNHYPHGELVSTTRAVSSTALSGTNVLVLNFPDGITHSIKNAVGNITIEYDATKGTLRGYGGPVQSFTRSFTPSSLEPKNNPDTVEHLTMNLSQTHNLIKITYHDTMEEEHLSMNLSATATLTYIGDL